MKVIYVDIDETICFYPEERRYELAVPDMENISKINKLFDDGNKVVYWTARGSTTGIDWFELTSKQLEQWGVRYSELKLGKPYYDIFICDKAFNSEDYFKK